MRTVALDLGARRTDLCEVDDQGVSQRAGLRSLRDWERCLGPATPPAQVAFEACREAWHVADRLRHWGHEPLMVDTTRVKQLGIGQHGRKNNRIDAEVLAVNLRAGRIPVAHLLSPQRQELRFHLTVRRMLVESRAQYVTAIRELGRARGTMVAACSAERFLSKLAQTELPEETRELMERLRIPLEALSRQVAEEDLALERLCDQEPVIRFLMTVPGVGLIVAAAFVSVIDEAGRFRNAHQVESYLGLVPSEDSTGDRRRLGAISKEGNVYLRALLVEASWALMHGKKDDPLRRWGRQVARRRGVRIAVVALARKLAGILWAVWRDGTVYDPHHVGETSARGLQRDAELRQLQAQALKMAGDKLVRRRQAARRVLDGK